MLNKYVCSRPEVAGPARGLAVICIHTDFQVKGIPMYSRPSAHADQENMERIWKLYDDCEVLSFKNEGNKFYNEEFEKKSKWYIMFDFLLHFCQFNISFFSRSSSNSNLLQKILKLLHKKNKINNSNFFIINCDQRKQKSLES